MQLATNPYQQIYVGGLSNERYRELTRRHEGRIFWSPGSLEMRSIREGHFDKGLLKNFLQKIFVASMNFNEATEIGSYLGLRSQSAENLARAFVEDMGMYVCCITDGVNPTYFNSLSCGAGKSPGRQDFTVLREQASGIFLDQDRAQDGFNTNGAGDTFAGALAALLEDGMPLDESVAIADRLAQLKLCCGQSHLGLADHDELAAYISDQTCLVGGMI